jgi:RNA polymerase sigma-70 factor (ECF subfamily)
MCISNGGERGADDLVVRAKLDRDALGRLYDRYFPVVHRYCLRRLFDRAAAEDVSSEVFLRVAASMRRFPGTTDTDFRCWIYRVATNAVNAHLRQRHRRSALLSRAARLGWWSREEAPSGAADPADVVGVEWADVARAMLALRPREQTAIGLRYLEGLSFGEVAAVMGERDGTVRVVVSRALERLRRLLECRRTVALTSGGKGHDSRA